MDGTFISPAVRRSSDLLLNARILGDQLAIAYRPDAEALCYGVINALHSAIEANADDTGESPVSYALSRLLPSCREQHK
jgi:hypothetical protein